MEMGGDDGMRLCGWASHLNPELSTIVPLDSIGKDVTAGGSNPIPIDIGDARYSIGGGISTDCHLRMGGDDVIISISMDRRGLILMESDSEGNDDILKEVMGELFLRMVKKVHDSIREFRFGSPLCCDPIFTISSDDDHSDGHDDVMHMFDLQLKSICNVMRDMVRYLDLHKYKPDPDSTRDYLIYNQYRMVMGSIAYAMNFVRLLVGSSKDRCIESLEYHRLIADCLYDSYCGFDVHRLNTAISETNDRIAEQNEASSRLASMVGLCTLLST